jgi:hypothetical protein
MVYTPFTCEIFEIGERRIGQLATLPKMVGELGSACQ